MLHKPGCSMHNKDCTVNSSCGWSCSQRAWSGPCWPLMQQAHLLWLSFCQSGGQLQIAAVVWLANGIVSSLPVPAVITNCTAPSSDIGTSGWLDHEGKTLLIKRTFYIYYCVALMGVGAELATPGSAQGATSWLCAQVVIPGFILKPPHCAGGIKPQINKSEIQNNSTVVEHLPYLQLTWVWSPVLRVPVPQTLPKEQSLNSTGDSKTNQPFLLNRKKFLFLEA